MTDIEESINDAVKKKGIVIGTRSVLKKMKRGEIKLVVYASNTPENFKSDLNHYAGVSSIEVKGFKGDSAQLGGLCGKPFHILAVGIKK
ncbi:MAG: 50S ribosomal protein L30e [Candidatus Aenigmarchaeota archaeon]|nr:50S ribosomal protein L30e [Candidatus Aenigmarchaeota archaeon]